MSVTLHEAIEHAREVSLRGCTECHKEHGQLADWLEELERLRSVLGEDYDLDRLRELVEENKKSRARKCPKCGKMKLFPRIDWKYFYCYSCETTFPAEEIIGTKSALAKEADHE